MSELRPGEYVGKDGKMYWVNDGMSVRWEGSDYYDIMICHPDFPAALAALQELAEEQVKAPWVHLDPTLTKRIRADGTEPETYSNEFNWRAEDKAAWWIVAFRKGLEVGRE